MGGVGSIFLFLPFILNKIISCAQANWFFCNDSYEVVAILVLPTPLLLLLSLITYKMRENVFRAWWNFARWFVPIIIIMTIILNNSGGGGTIGMNQDFTFFILGVLYTILAIVSLSKIYFAYGEK
jgi:hypothetical protein